MLPKKDPYILYGVINTKLRDYYKSLDELCDDLEEDREELEQMLEAVGFSYYEELNQFE